MQIRAATRQDEPRIAEIVFQSMEASGIQPDAPGLDRDLKGVEHNYFWYDGLCLVAESGAELLGVLAARRRVGEEEILDLTRLCVRPGAKAKETPIEIALVKTALFFAGNMEYKTIICTLPGRPGSGWTVTEPVMKNLGFARNIEGLWQLSVASEQQPGSRTGS